MRQGSVAARDQVAGGELRPQRERFCVVTGRQPGHRYRPGGSAGSLGESSTEAARCDRACSALCQNAAACRCGRIGATRLHRAFQCCRVARGIPGAGARRGVQLLFHPRQSTRHVRILPHDGADDVRRCGLPGVPGGAASGRACSSATPPTAVHPDADVMLPTMPRIVRRHAVATNGRKNPKLSKCHTPPVGSTLGPWPHLSASPSTRR